MFKGLGVRFADFISFFFNVTWKWNNLVSLRPNYLIFIGYLKTWGGEGVRANPLNPSGSTNVFYGHFIGSQGSNASSVGKLKP